MSQVPSPGADVLAGFDPSEAVQLTQQLIAIPSPLWQERAVAEWIGGWMAERGFEIEMQTVPLRDGSSTAQAICTLKGDGSGPHLMLCGHTDTSDWNGRPFREAEWKHDPFGGEVVDGMLYGLGAINMKAGVASIMLAADLVRRSGKPLKGDLTVACVAAETGGGVGAVHLVESGFRPDYCIVTEAGNLDVGVVSVGYVQGKVRIKGEFKARFPYNNPIEKATKAIAAFGPSYHPLKPAAEGGWLRFEPDPMIPGYPRMAVRGIEHFQDVTTLSFDLRIIPGMTEKGVVEDLTRLLDGIAAEDPDFHYELVVPVSEQQPNMPALPATDAAVPVVAELIKAHAQVTGRQPDVGAGHRIGATADTCHFKGVGIRCVEYGPGFIPTWPMVDECVEVEQIVTATRVLALTSAALVT
jgi:acetylornithine deacetylase/succinyl-diaminopimelate desuccinylase-like protein